MKLRTTIAWFRSEIRRPSKLFDDVPFLIGALLETHSIDVFSAARAHDFVWKHARDPYALTVYELENTPDHQFMWPYLLKFPGVLVLRTTTLHDSRAGALIREQRHDDYDAEMAFNGDHSHQSLSGWRAPRGRWPMLRVPLLASRLVVVGDPALAKSLQRDYPEARIRFAPIGVPEPIFPPEKRPPHPVTFGILDPTRAAVVHRAADRARAMGTPINLLTDPDSGRVFRESDVFIVLRWPAFGEPLIAAYEGMRASKAVVVFETFGTAGWPALDPQTWQPRGFSHEAPIVVSIDPRDEEHSLMIAMRRLATDSVLRDQLGAAAHDWWKRHATVAAASRAWLEILEEALLLEPPSKPPDWPSHLIADGTERARGILSEFNLSVDFLSNPAT